MGITMKNRVVVTGMGVISPLGNNIEEFTKNLLAGISPAAEINVFDPAALPTKIAAQVNTSSFELLAKDRKITFAEEACRSATKDANKSGSSLIDFYHSSASGLSMGLGLELFSMDDMVRYYLANGLPEDLAASTLTFLQTPSDFCLAMISREHKLTAPPISTISACAASTDAIGTAFHMVRSGYRSYMIAGGTDSMINPMGVAGFCKIKAMSTRNDDPKRASRPFDKNRDGFLLGEGAGALILETLHNAKKRGANILAEIVGYGNSFDAHGISEPHPEGEGAFQSMTRALADAQISINEISHINAHGTSTPKNDVVETHSIKRLFGEHAKKITINSTKSMIGHLISASGAVESIATISCAKENMVHSTINLDDPDPLCDLDYVIGQPQPLKPGYLLKNSFGFGGQNASLVLHTEISS